MSVDSSSSVNSSSNMYPKLVNIDGCPYVASGKNMADVEHDKVDCFVEYITAVSEKAKAEKQTLAF